MRNIAYIELDTHSELTSNFKELMMDSEKFRVDFYLSEKILKQLGWNENDNVIKVNPKNLISKLSLKHYDLVIVGTAHRYFSTFKNLVNQFPTYILVHNLNFSKISSYQLIKNIFKKDIIFRLKLLLKEGLLEKSKVYNNAKGFFVLDEEFVNEKSHYFPLFFNEYNGIAKNDIFRIVIPGAVSQKRRDYKMVLSVLSKINFPLDIIFLGKAEGEELDWIKKFNNEFVNLIYFTEKLNQNDFDFWMKSADVLWCPIQKETEFFSQTEHYGLTKITGNIGDAIKFGKVVLATEVFGYHPFVIIQNQDIIPQIEKVKKNHFDFKKYYSKESIKIKLESLFEELI